MVQDNVNEERKLRDPLNLVDLQASLEPLRQTCRRCLVQLQPWGDFMSMAKPHGDTWKRLQANVTHFQSNYVSMFISLICAAALVRPMCLLVTGAMGMIWTSLISRPSYDEAKIRVIHRPLELLFCALSALTLVLPVGRLFFVATVLPCALLVLVHAVLHPVPAAIAVFDDVSDVI